MRKIKTTVTPELTTEIQRVSVKEASDLSTKEGRYVICDAKTEDVIENAQGFGFTCYEKAKNYAIAQGWKLESQSSSVSSTPPLF